MGLISLPLTISVGFLQKRVIGLSCMRSGDALLNPRYAFFLLINAFKILTYFVLHNLFIKIKKGKFIFDRLSN